MADYFIPLYRRGEVKALVRVDPEDYERFGGVRWTYSRPHANGRWVYGIRRNGVTPGTDGTALVRLHREILGAPPFSGAEADHVNRDTLDCRRANLRWVTHAQNQQNQSTHRDNASGVRGVMFDPRRHKWYAQIKRGQRKIWIRYFNTRDDAAIAVAAARARLLPMST